MVEPITKEAEMKLEGKRLKAQTPAGEGQNLSASMEHLLITSNNPSKGLMLHEDLAEKSVQQIDESKGFEAGAANVCHVPIVRGQWEALIAQARAKVKSAMEALNQENVEKTVSKEK